MARQEEVFAQTIMDMKKAMQRKADDSEADEMIQKTTNRGNKRKRGARLVQEGKLDLVNPIQRSKQTVRYNGYLRDIISKNSLRVDPDGDVLDDADVDSTVELSDLEEEPYRDVRIEELLMPLTNAGALKDHPTLSVPYTSNALDEIIHNAQEMVQREQNNLWRLKQLVNGLRGDAAWMPCGAFEAESDPMLVQSGAGRMSPIPSYERMSDAVPTSADLTRVNSAEDPPVEPATGDGHDMEHEAGQNGIARADHYVKPDDAQDTSAVEEAGHATEKAKEALNGNPTKQGQASTDPKTEDPTQPLPQATTKAEDQTADPQSESKEIDPDETVEMDEDDNREENTNGEREDNDSDEDDQPQHRMTTRAKAAEAAPSPTLSATDSTTTDTLPHPFFLIPSHTYPSSNLGLPMAEAAETRRLIAMYIQKQEDAVRNSLKVLEGLLKARRLRDTVMEWCTSEAHVGEMSDGEDWYDKEYWGLEGDLKKGSDEMEGEGEEMGVGGRKKTRRARAGG